MVVATAEYPLVKESGQSFELNEGSHNISLIRKAATDSVNQGMLSLKIYNPSMGRPDEFKVIDFLF